MVSVENKQYIWDGDRRKDAKTPVNAMTQKEIARDAKGDTQKRQRERRRDEKESQRRR